MHRCHCQLDLRPWPLPFLAILLFSSFSTSFCSSSPLIYIYLLILLFSSSCSFSLFTSRLSPFFSFFSSSFYSSCSSSSTSFSVRPSPHLPNSPLYPHPTFFSPLTSSAPPITVVPLLLFTHTSFLFFYPCHLIFSSFLPFFLPISLIPFFPLFFRTGSHV